MDDDGIAGSGRPVIVIQHCTVHIHLSASGVTVDTRVETPKRKAGKPPAAVVPPVAEQTDRTRGDTVDDEQGADLAGLRATLNRGRRNRRPAD